VSAVVVREGDPHRAPLEGFVADHYRRCYGARVTTFLPTLLGLVRADAVLGVIGARGAEDGTPLFLERYLDAAVETVLADRLGSPVARKDLVEVGNLAGCEAGAGRALVTTLAAWLSARRVPWAVFTGTTALRNAFARLGIPTVDLGHADPARLGDERAAWGTYYDTEPRVTAADVAQVLRAGERDRRLSVELASARTAAAAAKGTWDDAARLGLARSA
jgi:hypothetical protein